MFHLLPSVGPKQLCALAHLGCTRKVSFNFSIGHAEYIARTDLAISHLEPWRGEIPVKFFASRIRFQIRIDDLRALVNSGQAQIDNILGMYKFFLPSN